MSNKSAHHPLAEIIGHGLKAATAESLVNASLVFNGDKVSEASDGLLRESTVRLRDGGEIRVRRKGEEVYAELVKDGQANQSEPSGTFVLADGKSIVLEKGKVAGGDVCSEARFLLFALLTGFPDANG